MFYRGIYILEVIIQQDLEKLTKRLRDNFFLRHIISCQIGRHSENLEKKLYQ